MKIFSGAVLAISCIPSTVAFVANTQKSAKTHLKLKAENGNNESLDHMVGPALAGLAGLTLASHMAVAAPFDPSTVVSTSPESNSAPIIVREDSTTELLMTRLETSPVSAISGSSIQLADDYLDFTMPSYGESASNSAKAKASESVPAFNNPFSDFSFSAPDTSAEDNASANAAAKESKEQAAAAKKAADEEAAAQKKAEKEARREAEKEKQRLAVQRANEVKEEKAAAAAAAASYDEAEVKAPELSIPEFKAPDIKVPEFKAPDFSVDVPEFKAPDVKLPEISLPKFSMPKMPDMPKIETPSVSTPSFSAPSTSFEAPKAPSFSAPSLEAPKATSFSAPSFEAPKLPSFSAPSFGGSDSSSGGYASLDEKAVDDQEERDVAAKAARTVFNEADADAKEVESKARKLRSIADEKKKIAKEAKDTACATRFGGKVICIRPFGIGY